LRSSSTASTSPTTRLISTTDTVRTTLFTTAARSRASVNTTP
jgi:hypothetical protein